MENEQKCPFSAKTLSGRSNPDWWPEKLNVQALHKHPPAGDPMGAQFDYAKEFTTVDLEAGRAVAVRLDYLEDIRDAEVRLAWRLPGAKPPFDEALDAANAADAVVFVGGLTGDVEGEEMRVDLPGFAGGDRTDLKLPASQQRLLEALHATDKPVVVVLTTGSALAVDWAQEHVPAILVAWYPGLRGGDAVGDVLFGAVSPAGRVRVTLY